jgi:hypothetical protein
MLSKYYYYHHFIFSETRIVIQNFLDGMPTGFRVVMNKHATWTHACSDLTERKLCSTVNLIWNIVDIRWEASHCDEFKLLEFARCNSFVLCSCDFELSNILKPLRGHFQALERVLRYCSEQSVAEYVKISTWRLQNFYQQILFDMDVTNFREMLENS